MAKAENVMYSMRPYALDADIRKEPHDDLIAIEPGTRPYASHDADIAMHDQNNRGRLLKAERTLPRWFRKAVKNASKAENDQFKRLNEVSQAIKGRRSGTVFSHENVIRTLADMRTGVATPRARENLALLTRLPASDIAGVLSGRRTIIYDISGNRMVLQRKGG